MVKGRSAIGAPDTLTMPAKQGHGSGRALEAYLEGPLARSMRMAFGSTVYGTFNVLVPDEDFARLRAWPVTRHINTKERPGGIPAGGLSFILCEIATPTNRRAGWIVWDTKHEPRRKAGGYGVGLVFREPLPTDFQVEPLTLSAFARWSPKRIDEWAKPQRWFQTFAWAPRCRANSAIVWSVIESAVSVSGRTLLDIGCSAGFHTIRAARAGAIATGVECSHKLVAMARDIARHIEMSDAGFLHINEAPAIPYDVILYLSVAHHESGDYGKLKETLRGFRERCHDLLVEVILPPLEGEMPSNRVERIIGGERLLAYEHRLHGNRQRRLYHVRGVAK